MGRSLTKKEFIQRLAVKMNEEDDKYLFVENVPAEVCTKSGRR
jgi:hypothetical protein